MRVFSSFILRSVSPGLPGLLVFLSVWVWGGAAFGQSRIKDIVDIEGVRDNLLIGYGLVVGLNGTGDTLQNAVFTRESLVGMLERLGVNARQGNLDTDNIAAVIVTATLPPFARQGTRIDIQVSALGDATSLQGGTLLVTPLVGADGEVYAVGQGQIAAGGFLAQADDASFIRGVPTAGRVSSGALVEREIAFAFHERRRVHLALKNPDLTTATRIAQTINSFLAADAAFVQDPGTVQLQTPLAYSGTTVELLTEIEQLRVDADQPARVVIDESTGVIVMGQNVRILQVAVAQGNLTVQVGTPSPLAIPFSNTGETLPVPPEVAGVPGEEGALPATLAEFGRETTLRELVQGLNALGVGPRDMIAILQAIRAAGALQADIDVI